MLSIALVIAPIFALIFAGYLARKLGILGPESSSELNRFVVYLALPALLFRVTALADRTTFWQPRFIATFTIGCFAIFAATLLYKAARGRHLSDASIDALNAAYANTGYIGFPLCQLVFGRESLVLVTVAAIVTACVLFAFAVILVELGVQTERRPLRLGLKVAASLGRNPLLVAPTLGALWAVTGLPLPSSVGSFLTLLGAAASPCALVALGLFLAARPEGAARHRRTTLALTLLKLVGQPAVTAFLAYKVFALPPTAAAIVVVLAALPTGTGSFMVAEFYRREAVVTSGTILFSTIGSVATITLCLMLMGIRPG